MNKIYDCIVIGGGPCAIVAALYLSRSLKSNLLITEFLGGQIAFTDSIQNWPGELDISGMALVGKMIEQLTSNGGKVNIGKVNKIEKKDGLFVVHLKDVKHLARTCIIATGAQSKMLGIENEDKMFGTNKLHTCSLCDGSNYKGKVVAIVGGGNKAVEDAIYMENLASKIFLIHRRKDLRAEEILQKRLMEIKNLELVLEEEIKEMKPHDRLTLVLKNKSIEVDGLFLAIGTKPNSGFLTDVEKDKDGYININENFETNIKDMFAAGEVADKKFRQLSTSIGFGTCAALSVISRLSA